MQRAVARGMVTSTRSGELVPQQDGPCLPPSPRLPSMAPERLQPMQEWIGWMVIRCAICFDNGHGTVLHCYPDWEARERPETPP